MPPRRTAASRQICRCRRARSIATRCAAPSTEGAAALCDCERPTAGSTSGRALYDERVKPRVIPSVSEESGRWPVAPARPDPSLTLRVTAAFVVLLFSTSAFAGVINRDVEREVREHGSARVIVMMRGAIMPALTSDDFSLIAKWDVVRGF